jgi:hypothetical protein
MRLPPFISRLPEYDVTWIEELVGAEMPTVKGLANRVSDLKGLGLTGVSMVTSWVACRVIPLKK